MHGTCQPLRGHESGSSGSVPWSSPKGMWGHSLHTVGQRGQKDSESSQLTMPSPLPPAQAGLAVRTAALLPVPGGGSRGDTAGRKQAWSECNCALAFLSRGIVPATEFREVPRLL
ncbi:hypothetical protein KIL84_002227 [Mauremys mutica]|uniref:Uncharacterized protein n=1 Tax=Mauremys mutica TaxID=74926 RepID=A0A9D3X740_9SAUR|nr:hypothetical protein KIL84_002227 [Mauremys mutica]